MIDTTDTATMLAEAKRRQALRARGATTFSDVARALDRAVGDMADPNPRTRIIDPREVGVDEKTVEHLCDQLAQKCGARVVRFSHPGKTKQTEGIADRLYCFTARGFALWYEVKSEDGRQRPGQRLFEEYVTACGHRYACGGLGDFKHWLVTNGVVTGFDADGSPITSTV